jgi:CRP/FNR family transcriptional regulator, cyclic AMP receptor protein
VIDVETVRKLPRFSGLSPDAHRWLSEKISRKSYKKGEMLFFESEDSTFLYLVERGAVKVFRSLESGRELILGLFRHGDAIGEVALIDGQGYPASAAAHEDSTVLLMRRNDYLYYLKCFDGAAIALLRDLMMRMRTMQRRMEDLGGGGVEYRLGRVLQTLCAAAGKTGEPVYVTALLTRQDFADMVGARVETVIRIMSRWQKEGLVGTDERGFWVRDRAALDALVRSQ